MNDNIKKEAAYEGYLWYSDRKKPDIYTKEKPFVGELKLDHNDNPFIIEGQLYDENQHLSYSVKYVDGHYIVKEYNIQTALAECTIKDKFYQSNRMDGKILHFMECWKGKGDPLCCGIEVLQPNKIIFVGFKK